MPAYDTAERHLRESIASVTRQLYPEWELCIADDASPSPHVWDMLRGAAAQDGRIKIVRRTTNGHISAATNSALALATGEFVVPMDHDDILSDLALHELARAIGAHPDADILYSDEDRIDGRGRRSNPHFKTEWNPELLLGQNYVNHLVAYRRTLIEGLGGLRVGFEGSQDYDLALRASEATTPDRIQHIRAVLYHWRRDSRRASFSEVATQRCADAARRAVSEHLERTGVVGAVTETLPDTPGWVRVRRAVPDPAPLVSVIVLTRGSAASAERWVRGLLDGTDYPAIEVLASTSVDVGDLVDCGQTLTPALSPSGATGVTHMRNDSVQDERVSIPRSCRRV